MNANEGLDSAQAEACGSLWSRVDLACIALALAVTAMVLGRGISVGGFRSGDGAVHALDGVLIYDWVRAGPRASAH